MFENYKFFTYNLKNINNKKYMKKQKLLLWLFLLLTLNKTLWYQELVDENIEWKKVKYIKVVLDNEHEVITSISENWDTLEDLVKKVWWISWVNWAYFCPADYKQCEWINYSENMRFYNWEKYSKFKDDLWVNWLFWFDENGVPLFILNNYGYVEWINKKFNQEKLKDVKHWLSNFPVLLLQWENVIGDSENILDIKQKTSWIKSFICSLNDNKTILMWTINNVTVKEMAKFIQKNLNCYNAINLDSWWSLWMIYNNKTIKKPWRKIMDAFIVIKKVKKKEIILPKNFTNKLDNLYKNNPNLIKKILVKISISKENYKNNNKKYLLIEAIENYIKNL